MRRQPPILAAYEHFGLDRQGMLVSPRTLEYYDGMVLPFLRWAEAGGVQKFEALEVSRLRVYRAQLATRPGRHGQRLQPKTILEATERDLGPRAEWLELIASNPATEWS